MVALPANVTYGTITGRIITAVADTSDTDSVPDAIPAEGQVTFTPRALYIKDVAATSIIAPRPVIATLVNGYITNPGNSTVQSVGLIATDSPALLPTGWTYLVSFDLIGVELPSFDIAVPGGTTVDLTGLIPVSSSAGAVLDVSGVLMAKADAAVATANQALTAAQNAGSSTNASALTSGTVPVARLGSGGTRAAGYYLDGTNTWVQVTGGGSTTTDASLLVSGILPVARIGDASITDAKLASGVAMTAAERAKVALLSGTNTGDQTSVTGNAGTATKLATARTIGGVSFDGSASISLTSASLTDFASASDARIAAAAGVTLATLSGGKIPTSQIPAIALTQVTTYTTTAAMIAANIQEGDVGVVTVGGVTTSYMRNAGVTGTMTDYTPINTPDGAGVTSVNGYSTASVVLAASDLGLGAVNNTADSAKVVLSASKLTTARTIAGVSFDGTAAITLNGSGIVFTPQAGIGATNVSAAVVEAMNDAIAAAVRLVFPNYDSQFMAFDGFGNALPGTIAPAGHVYLVAA